MHPFKAYDVRGIVPQELDEQMAYWIGRATARFLKAKQLVVGRDMRETSGPLSDALCRGIQDHGTDVVWIGQCTSPMCYFAVGRYGYDGGVMVTASHNPARYNGMKFCRAQAVPIGSNSGLMQIEEFVRKNLGKQQGDGAKAQGKRIDKEISEDYVSHAAAFAEGIKPLKMAVDAGNGMAGPFLPRVAQRLGLQVTGMYMEPDGNFPNHEADPLKDENLEDLQETMRREKFDLGIALDGDGDRVAFVDENARRVPNDLVGALIANEFLSREKAAVIYDLRSSRVVAEEIKRSGGKPIESRVGHSFIKTLMRENNAIFGSELSGHYYFRDNYYADSADIAWLTIVKVLSREGRPFSQIVEPLRRYHATGEVNFVVADKDAVLAQLCERYGSGTISKKDGVSVHFKDWWFNVRPSNTEPVLRLNLEAGTKEMMEEKRAELEAILSSQGSHAKG